MNALRANWPEAAWAAFLVLGGLFAFIAVHNAVILWRQAVLKEKMTRSMIPILGGLLGLAGMSACPLSVIANNAWLALFLDVGCVPYLILAFQVLARQRWKTSKFNLLEEYRGVAGPKTIFVRLFRKSIFTIQLAIARQGNDLGLLRRSAIGTWRREDGRLILTFDQKEAPAVFNVLPGRSPETLRLSASGFELWERSGETSLAGIDLVRTTNTPPD